MPPRALLAANYAMNANAASSEPDSRRLEELSHRLVGVFYEVYNELGYGFSRIGI